MFSSMRTAGPVEEVIEKLNRLVSADDPQGSDTSRAVRLGCPVGSPLDKELRGGNLIVGQGNVQCRCPG